MSYLAVFRFITIVVIICTVVVNILAFRKMVSAPIAQRHFYQRRLAFSLVALVFLLSGLVFLC